MSVLNQNPDGGVRFLNACYLLGPDVVTKSIVHDGSGRPAQMKEDDGTWDQRPHRSRVRIITGEVLSTWSPDESVGAPPFLFAVNNSIDNIARKIWVGSVLGQQYQFHYWYGFGETSGVDQGAIKDSWTVERDPERVILQGPHLNVCNPVFQNRGVERKNHRDWNIVDLRILPGQPRWEAGYRIADSVLAARQIPTWGSTRATDLYRIAWRRRVSAAGARSLMPAIVPPGVKHIETIVTIGNEYWSPSQLALLCGICSSLLADFQVRVAQRADIRPSALAKLYVPANIEPRIRAEIELRTMRLNCLNYAYKGLWDEWLLTSSQLAGWTCEPPVAVTPVSDQSLISNAVYSAETPLRSPWGRRQALVELDALVAIAFGLTVGELIELLRGQFGVLRSELRRHTVLPNGSIASVGIGGEPIDMEDDLRRAYAAFERRLAERS